MADETTKFLWHGGVCTVELDTDLAFVYYSLIDMERNALTGYGPIDTNAVCALRHMRKYIDKLAMEKMK